MTNEQTVPDFLLAQPLKITYHALCNIFNSDHIENQMTFNEYMAIAAKNTDILFDASWGQGRSVFGGLTAAMILKRIESEAHQLDRNLRSVHVNFCGPVQINEPCDIAIEILSNSRSVIQIQGSLKQNGEIKTHLIACFANGRPSGINIEPPARTIKSKPDQLTSIPYIPNITPNMIQHLVLKPDNNSLPFSGSKHAEVRGWMNFKDSPNQMDDCALLALIDGWPPAVLPLLKQPAPASTITWNVEFIQPRSLLNGPERGFYYDCQVRQGAEGYSHTLADIYDDQGRLISMSRQLVGVYDQRSQ